MHNKRQPITDFKFVPGRSRQTTVSFTQPAERAKNILKPSLPRPQPGLRLGGFKPLMAQGLRLTKTIPRYLSSSFFFKKIQKLWRRSTGRHKTIAATVLIVLFIVIPVLAHHSVPSNLPKAAVPPASHKPITLTHGTPSYANLLPEGKSIKSLGGWTRVSPPDHNPVYAYQDKIGAVSISVSEQPLPANFKNDTAKQIADLAQNFNATEKVMAGTTVIYIGTSANGPQSVIFTKADLLILIKSTSIIPSSQWSAYVDSLQ